MTSEFQTESRTLVLPSCRFTIDGLLISSTRLACNLWMRMFSLSWNRSCKNKLLVVWHHLKEKLAKTNSHTHRSQAWHIHAHSLVMRVIRWLVLWLRVSQASSPFQTAQLSLNAFHSSIQLWNFFFLLPSEAWKAKAEGTLHASSYMTMNYPSFNGATTKGASNKCFSCELVTCSSICDVARHVEGSQERSAVFLRRLSWLFNWTSINL